jgi:hypothetical protein
VTTARSWIFGRIAVLWLVAAAAEAIAYGRLTTYERQRAVGTVHRVHSPLLQPLYPALGVSDVRHLMLKYVVWLLIPGVSLLLTWSWIGYRRSMPDMGAGESSC